MVRIMFRRVAPGFPVSCCSIALRDKPVAEALERIAQAGFSAVELWLGHFQGLPDSGLREVAAQSRHLGVEITVLAPYFRFTRGPAWAEESLRDAGAVLGAAAVLGVKKIRTFVDCGPDGLASAQATDADWAAATAGLQKVCRLDGAVEFVVETHDNTLADTLPSVRRLLDAVAMPNLRLNFQANDDFMKRGFLACLQEVFPAVSHMHWQQIGPGNQLTYVEEAGAVDFGELVAFLRRKDYAGTASVEYCWPDVPEERLASACRFLEPLFAAGVYRR